VDPLVVEQRWFAGSLWRPGVWIFVSGSWERFVLFFDVLDQNREKKIALLGNGDLVAVDTFPTPCPADDTVTSLERSRSFTGPPPAAASGDTPISQAFCSFVFRKQRWTASQADDQLGGNAECSGRRPPRPHGQKDEFRFPRSAPRDWNSRNDVISPIPSVLEGWETGLADSDLVSGNWVIPYSYR
jgi:hypothetical protein